MKVISFYNVKGGTGKTSLSYLSGQYLSSIGKRVLFVDLDPQASLTHRLLEAKPQRTIYNLLAENESLSDCIQEINPRLSIIAGELRVNKIFSGIMERTFKKLFIPTLLSQNDLDSVQFTLSEFKEIDENLKPLIILNRTSKLETKEETEYLQAYNFDSPMYRFPVSTSVKKVLDRGESLELKKHSDLKETVLNMLSIKEIAV